MSQEQEELEKEKQEQGKQERQQQKENDEGLDEQETINEKQAREIAREEIGLFVKAIEEKFYELFDDLKPRFLHDGLDDPHDMYPTSLLMESGGYFWYQTNCCWEQHNHHSHPHMGLSISAAEQTIQTCLTTQIGSKSTTKPPKNGKKYDPKKYESITRTKGSSYSVFWGEKGVGTKKLEDKIKKNKDRFETNVKHSKKTIQIANNEIAKKFDLADQEFEFYTISTGKNTFYVAHKNAAKGTNTKLEMATITSEPDHVGNLFFLNLKLGNNTFETFLVRKKG